MRPHVLAFHSEAGDDYGLVCCEALRDPVLLSAFIGCVNGKRTTSDELREWCRQNLAGFKVPSEFRFEPIPKTSTGKVQKFALRQRILDKG